MKMFRIQTLNNFCIKSLCPDNSFPKSGCMTAIDPYVGNRVTSFICKPILCTCTCACTFKSSEGVQKALLWLPQLMNN